MVGVEAEVWEGLNIHWIGAERAVHRTAGAKAKYKLAASEVPEEGFYIEKVKYQSEGVGAMGGWNFRRPGIFGDRQPEDL